MGRDKGVAGDPARTQLELELELELANGVKMAALCISTARSPAVGLQFESKLSKAALQLIGDGSRTPPHMCLRPGSACIVQQPPSERLQLSK
ncbi:hypothetical protein AWZ03_003022 [Drosophila navojoa]|uniref:Uncharacterized protein n=1 Tax=Drosophila navojoa TaxID=7232 RepID=A0A484BNT9_DRONA|nr:hypothetical protein AWZ03_003022 [Drosophila navojoa]